MSTRYEPSRQQDAQMEAMADRFGRATFQRIPGSTDIYVIGLTGDDEQDRIRVNENGEPVPLAVKPPLGPVPYLPSHNHGEDEPCSQWCPHGSWQQHVRAHGNVYDGRTVAPDAPVDHEARGRVAELRAAYERARELANGEAIAACEVLLIAVRDFLGDGTHECQAPACPVRVPESQGLCDGCAERYHEAMSA